MVDLEEESGDSSTGVETPWHPRRMIGEAARTAPRRIDLGGAGRHPGPVALARVLRLAPHLPGAGVGRAGRRRGVQPRPGAADGPAAGLPGPPAPPGRDGDGGRRADSRRRRGALAAEPLANVLAV